MPKINGYGFLGWRQVYKLPTAKIASQVITEVIFLIIGAVLINTCAYCFAEEHSLELEPILVTKSKIHLLSSYSLDAGTPFFDSVLQAPGTLPVDMQSRSPAAGIQTDFSLRGSSHQGVLLLVDSKRVNDPQTGHHNSDIPLTKEDVERIDLVPGAGSSIFGPDCIGGAINISRKKPQGKKLIFETGIGQYKSGWGLFSLSGKSQNLGLRVSIENRESAGFYEDTDFKKLTGALSSTLEFPDGDLNFNFGYQEKEFGAYDFYTPASGYLSKEWTKTYLADTDLRIKKGLFLIAPSFLWRRHFDKFALDKTTVRSRYLNHHYTDLDVAGIYIQRQDSVLGACGAGIEYTQERIRSTNLGDHQRERRSIFLDDHKDITTDLTLGLSWRLDEFYGFGGQNTGSATARYSLSQADSLYLGISRSIRAPSFTELYYNDPVTLGSDSLGVEKALNYQAGYDYRRERISGGVTFFLRREKDFIDWIKRAPGEAKWQVENISSANVAGTEAYLRFPLHDKLEFDSNYSYIDKRLYDNGYIYKYGPNYLKHLINCIFTLNTSLGQQAVALAYKKRPRRDGWLLVNSHFSYDLKKGCKIFLDISNIFNVEYQEIEGIPSPGRWIESGVRFEW